MTEVHTEVHLSGAKIADRTNEIQSADGRELLVRTFGVQAEMADDRTIDVRVVPFDEIATVADPPDFKPYEEQWMPGVFSHQENAANRVYLRVGSGHDQVDGNGNRKPGLAGVVGHGQTLASREDGYHARFKMHTGAEADTARELVGDGVLTGVSAEFFEKRNVRTREGVIQRVKADLDSVLLTPNPAYSKAQVLAMREEDVVTLDEELMPPPINKTLLERCAELGVDLPEGMAILLTRAYTEIPWDGSASRWDTPEAYCAAAAIDLNMPGGPKTKDRCHLPFKEPGSGAINVSGVRAALSRIGQGFPQDATQAQRDAAKTRLEKILAAFNSTSSST
jgi:HK97 family phage prohead protease